MWSSEIHELAVGNPDYVYNRHVARAACHEESSDRAGREKTNSVFRRLLAFRCQCILDDCRFWCAVNIARCAANIAWCAANIAWCAASSPWCS